MGGFHALEEEKNQTKVGRKLAFLAQFSCNRSSLSFSLRCGLQPQPPSSPVFSTIISTTRSHQTISRGGCTVSLSLLQNFASLPL
jgi:hypothetical protein